MDTRETPTDVARGLPPEGPPRTLPPELHPTLLQVARLSIDEGLRRGRPLEVSPEDYPPPLREPRATFVTLRIGGALRGCIGTLEATEPLIRDAAIQAYGAAFRDPRFPALIPPEADRLEIHVSILSPPAPIVCGSEEELLAALRPGVDGLILSDGGGDEPSPWRGRRSTFLPAVWETLPDPQRFLEHLKDKAGLPPDYWSPTLRFWRYTTQSVS